MAYLKPKTPNIGGESLVPDYLKDPRYLNAVQGGVGGTAAYHNIYSKPALAEQAMDIAQGATQRPRDISAIQAGLANAAPKVSTIDPALQAQRDMRGASLAAFNTPQQSVVSSSPVNTTYNTANPYDTSAEISAFREAETNRRYAALDQARAKSISGLQKEQATIAPQYYDKRNQANVQMNNNARSFSEYLAARGLASSGIGAQGQLSNLNQYQGNIGSLNRQEQAAYDDITRRTSDVETDYQFGRANAGNEAASLAAQMNIQELGKQRDYAREDARNRVVDTGYLPDGTQTIAGKTADAAIKGQNIANDTAAANLAVLPEILRQQVQKGDIDIKTATVVLNDMIDPNSLTNRLKKLNVDTEELKYKYLEPSLKAEAELITQQIEKGSIDIETGKAELKELIDPNSLTNRLKKANVDTAELNFKYLEPSLKAEAESIALDLEGKRIDNKTAEAALKELTDPNSLTNRLKKLEVDTATLNLKYLEPSLKAEAESVALDLANKKIDKKIAEAQLKELTDPKSVTNQLKQIGLKTEKLNLQYLPQNLKNEAASIANDLATGKINNQIAQQQLDNLKAGKTKDGKSITTPNTTDQNSVTFNDAQTTLSTYSNSLLNSKNFKDNGYGNGSVPYVAGMANKIDSMPNLSDNQKEQLYKQYLGLSTDEATQVMNYADIKDEYIAMNNKTKAYADIQGKAAELKKYMGEKYYNALLNAFK